MGRFPDISVADVFNATTTLLGPGGTFTGAYTDVSGFTSVTLLIFSNAASAANGMRLQWSTDGVNLDDEQRFTYAGSASEQGRAIHATVRARFFRIQYINGGSSQTTMRLATLLRRGPAQGSVGSAGIGITTEHDAVIANSVLVTRQVDSPSTLVMPFSTGDPFLITTHPPNTSVVQNETTVTAQTAFSQALDFFGIFGGSRHHFHVFNDTVRGNLHIRFGSSGASLTAFNVKVPAQHSYAIPLSWRIWPGQINGIWDVADGSARCAEWF